MATNVASVKQTSGEGFDFENKVVAFFLLDMLSGVNPFPKIPGTISSVATQKRVDGWFLDDIVLTIANGTISQSVGFSVKSNNQLMGCAIPQEFSILAWELFLSPETSVFTRGKDWLGLITPALPDPESSAMATLLKLASEQNSTNLAERLAQPQYTNICVRKLYDSILCPDRLLGNHSTPFAPGDILKWLIIQEYDFDRITSKDASHAISRCSQILKDGSANSATLWERLQTIARDIRHAGGEISRAALIDKVRLSFALADAGDYQHDWSQLRKYCGLDRVLVKQHIGQSVTVDRRPQTEALVGHLAKNSFTALIGESGSGKSSLLHATIKNQFPDTTILWIETADLVQGLLRDIESGLTHSLTDCLQNRNTQKAFLIIDNVEKFSNAADTRQLEKLFAALGENPFKNGWHVIIVCRNDFWDKIELKIIPHFGISPSQVKLNKPSTEELSVLEENYPSIKNILQKKHLEPIINFKILDVLANALESGLILPQDFTSESSLSSWWWNNRIVNALPEGLGCSVMLKRIADREAEDGSFSHRESEFSPEELRLLQDMPDIIARDKFGRIKFVHDLFADWARFQKIEEELPEDKINFINDKAENPFWHKAIYLYGGELLSSGPADTLWRQALEQSPKAKNLLWDAVILSDSQHVHLTSLANLLFEENGKILQNYIKRFLYIATENNKIAREFDIENSASKDIRRYCRKPLVKLWAPVLVFINNYLKEIIHIVPVELAEIAIIWLRNVRKEEIFYPVVVKIAVMLGWDAYHRRAYEYDEGGKLAFEAALWAYPGDTESIRALTLKASGRIPPTEKDGENWKGYAPPGAPRQKYFLDAGPDRVPDPWPLGPISRPNGAFREICLHKNGLAVVMLHDTELAGEIILSLCIEQNDGRKQGLLDCADMGLVHHFGFYPRFYNKGPFLTFLDAAPKQALYTIISLIDFCTERWREDNHSTEVDGITLLLDGEEKKFIGDSNVYHFYHGNAWNNIVSSALMALEKWFYSQIDNNQQEIHTYIELILKEAKSVAFIGLLTEIGRYNLSLLSTVFKPLLYCWENYLFESSERDHHLFGTPFNLTGGEHFFNLAREWDSMPHRKNSIYTIAIHLFLASPDAQKEIIPYRSLWKKQISRQFDAKARECLEMAILQFSVGNWTSTKQEDGREGYSFSPPPELIERNLKRQSRAAETLFLIAFPYRANKILRGEELLVEEELPYLIEQVRAIGGSATPSEGSNPGNRFFRYFLFVLSSVKKNIIKRSWLSKEAPKAEYSDDENSSFLNGKENERDESRSESKIASLQCALAAVLLIKAEDWLKQRAEVEIWCHHIIIGYLYSPPRRSSFDFVFSKGKEYWDDFITHSIVHLWKNDTTNKNLRRDMFECLMSYHDSASASVILDTYVDRHNYLDDFKRLLFIFIETTKIKYFEFTNSMDRKKADKFINHLCRDFVKRKSPVDIADWATLLFEPPAIGYLQHLARGFAPYADIRRFQLIIRGLFALPEANDDDEFIFFVSFWQQVVILIVTPLKARNPGHESSYPDEFAREALGEIAKHISLLSEHRLKLIKDLLLKEILVMHSVSTEHMELFIDSLYKNITNSKTETVCEIILYIIAEYKKYVTMYDKSQRFRAQKSIRSLLGMSKYLSRNVDDNYLAVLKEIIKHHDYFQSFILCGDHAIEEYAYWLSNEKLIGLRHTRLKSLSAAVGIHKNLRSETYEQIVTLLYSVWSKESRTVMGYTEIKESFYKLLFAATESGNTSAIAFRDRMKEL